MTVVSRWSTLSLIFYILLAISICLLFNNGIKNRDKKIKIKKITINYITIISVIIYIILMFFSCFRTLGIKVGGADALGYVNEFLKGEFIPWNFFDIIKMKGTEPLFYNLMSFIREFTDSHYIMFFIIYSIMYIPMIKFVFDNSDDNKSFCYTLILLPYLYSFAMIRNMMGIILSLYGINFLKKEKYGKSILFLILGYLSHFSSIIFAIYAIFYKLILDKRNKKNDVSFFVALTFFIMSATLLLYPMFESFASTSRYLGYLDNDISLWGYLTFLILLVLMIKYRKELVKNYNDKFMYYLVMFNMAIMPIAILCRAGNRISIFFLIPRIIMWAKLENVFLSISKNKFTEKGIKAIFLTLSLLWITFRIYRSWAGSGYMPYYNDIINMIMGWS